VTSFTPHEPIVVDAINPEEYLALAYRPESRVIGYNLQGKNRILYVTI
jgi:hypothetical protein